MATHTAASSVVVVERVAHTCSLRFAREWNFSQDLSQYVSLLNSSKLNRLLTFSEVTA